MKKLMMAFSVVALMGSAALTSCNSEKDCECVTTSNGTEQGRTTVTIEDGDCEDSNTTSSAGGTELKVTCTEK